MDWQTVLTAVVTSLLSSSLITAGVIYIAKKSIDRLIDLRYEKLLEETKLQAQESSRRKAALYDQQSEALQKLVSHVHRLRRLARDMWKLLSHEKRRGKEWGEFDQAHQEFEKYFEEFREFVSNNRVLFTHEYLGAQHEIASLTVSVRGYRQLMERTTDKTLQEELTNDIQSKLERLDEEYLALLNLAQIRLGILEDKRSN